MKLTPLTDMQMAVFSFCQEWLEERQSFPSTRVLAASFGFKSQNAACCHLNALVKKGYLTRWSFEYKDPVKKQISVSRGLKITESAKDVSFENVF